MWYKPLDNTKNEIRILRFLGLSSSISPEDPVRCSIRNVPLEERSSHFPSDQSYLPDQHRPISRDRFTKCVDLRDATLEKLTVSEAMFTGPNQAHNQVSKSRFVWGDFEALSYTWGKRGDVKSIIVNGMHKDVPKNLEAALRALRNLPETRLGMRYWVDSLCINQEDEEERSEQVKRMKAIYGRARAVIVWLGQEEKTDKVAVQTMQHLCLDPNLKNPLMLPTDLLTDGRSALSAFAQKPYWNRAWIIQELAMNQNSTLILCGEFRLTRRMIRLGADYFQKSLKAFQDRSYQFDNVLGPDVWSIASRIYRLANLVYNPDLEESLTALLNLVRGAKATDARDKVYGILGLLDPAISADLAPDYSLSDQEVYKNFMKSVIKRSGRLDEIAYVGTHVEKAWESWVPDLRLPFGRHHIRYLRSRSASGNEPMKVRFVEQGKNSTLLVCSGLQVDVVDGTAAEPPLHRSTQSRYALDRYGSRKSEALQQTLLMGHPIATPGTIMGYPKATTGVLKPGVIRDVLLKVPWPLEHSSSPRRPKICQSNSFRRFDKFRKHNRGFSIGGQSFESFFPAAHNKRLKVELTLRHLRLAMLSLEQRALITTETGYLGLAPAAVRQGDVVTILFGCRFPMVLRPYLDDMYQVIGECYIHDLMDGEILSQQRNGHVSSREFVLC
ncbi:hypothetical protein AA0119_g11946 [Alternaria tenuissima]|uniref:Heterokaryon incompatibility domain-containing protein n=1 Tax=Alternaria tenuissima TaxID=119927 RepID=A0ABY0FSQ6_9PLEO|nr:hypothetical protein AA0119_g11946 [Alternaria tenuissima]RYO07057.1 hypothetical protein AA0121_g11844 [Alternaria tenuissima]RYO62402.1 hypothetical protein AA0116_g5150 [Alternaria tenuissima]